jgi:histidine triad (HIT) family protein
MSIFARIIAGELPAERVYEDEHCIVINDIHPQAPVHVLVIPKKALTNLNEAAVADQALLGHLLLTVPRIAAQLGMADGYRVIINNGASAGQTVFHLHLHVLGGQRYSEQRLGQ